jgi:UDP-N-acetylmuramyl-tripeptide synthetase
MNLNDLLKGYNFNLINGDKNAQVSDITYSSKEVKKNSLFVAIKGEKSDGHNYIHDAEKKGASVLVVQDTSQVGEAINNTVIQVNDSLDALAYLSSKFYDDPTNDIKISAVTGTNGKTTVTYLIESIWKGENQIAGVIGTINYRFGQTQYPSALTTPLSKELQQLFSQMRESGVQNVVVEASSHALDKKRLDYTNLDSAVFTNLTQDHLDYHKDFSSYFNAKKRLFSDILNDSGKTDKYAVSNYDDPYGKTMTEDFRGEKVYYSVDNPEAHFYARNIEITTKGIKAEVVTPDGTMEINSELLGRHNLSNILAAIAGTMVSGACKDSIKNGIASLKNVPGRLERMENSKGINIFVDYAHTPDALGNVLKSIKSLCIGRLIVVFGCGGDRDTKKRPIMGSFAAKLADIVIVTSDNPRTEDPEKIIFDIEKGIKEVLGSDSKYFKITNRYKAILRAVQISEENDTVLIAGKGHEDYQIVGDEKIHFDDREMCSKALEEAGYSIN